MKVVFQRGTEFSRQLRERVDAYLAEQDEPSIRRAMLRKTAAIAIWLLVSYLLLVFVAETWWQAVPLAMSLGLALAAVGFSIQHDANHGAYPVGSRTRQILGFTLDMIGGSSYIWRFQHNVNHHAYTNVVGADADIDLGGLVRLAPGQRHHRIHRLQHLYVWPLYSLLVLNWLVLADWRDLWRGRIGENIFPRPRGRKLAALLGGKLLAATFWLGIPALVRPIGWVAVFALGVVLALGLVLAVVFQLAHVVQEVDFTSLKGDPARSSSEWVVHQLSATSDFAPKSAWLSWFLGGLNFQVEHHLFPRVCHLHYPRMARIVSRTCEEFGVPYHVHPTFTAALRSHVRQLRHMGRPISLVQPAETGAAGGLEPYTRNRSGGLFQPPSDTRSAARLVSLAPPTPSRTAT